MRNPRSSRVTMGVLLGEARKHQYPTSVGLANATRPQGDLVHIYTGHTTSVAEIGLSIYTFSGALAYRYAVATQAACKVHGVGEEHCWLSGLNLI